MRRSTSSYGHKIVLLGGGYWLWWKSDRFYVSSRLRYPHSYSRETDEKGALRFAKKWKIAMPS